MSILQDERALQEGQNDEDFGNALRRLISVGQKLEADDLPLAVASGDALRDTLALLAPAMGISIKSSIADSPALTMSARIAAYGHVSGFRARAVTLRSEWWRNPGPPMLGVDRRDDTPVALLACPKGYMALRTNTTEVLLDEDSAAQLEAAAFVLYDTLPERADAKSFMLLALRDGARDIARVLLAAFGAAALALVVPVVFGQAVDLAIPEGRLPLLFELTLMLVAAALSVSLLQAYKAFAIARLTGRADLRLQAAVWDRVLRLTSVSFRRWQTGDLALRLLGVDGMRRILSASMLDGILSGVFGVMNMIVMVVLSGSLTIWAIGYAAIFGTAFAGLTLAQVRRQRESYDLRGKVQALIIQFLSAIPKIRVGGAERRAFSRWAEIYARQRGASARSGVLRSASSTLQAAMIPIASLGVFVVIAAGGHDMDTARFITFNAAQGQFLAAVAGLCAAITGSLGALPLWERLQPLLSAPVEEVIEREDPGPLDGSITARDLVFRYIENGPVVIRHTSFAIAPGQFVAVVGPSGCGKSTLIRLLLGFEKPESGTVFYGNRDLSRLDVRRVRQQIGTVLQTVGLTPGTIFENVSGSRQPTDEEVWTALRMAGLAEDVEKLPMGLHTVVSESGSNFSGGQRQRLMIARALIAKPKIVLFDEATSALDNATQRIVTDSLKALSATRIVIAHRLSTIIDADVILVMDKGEIVERGTYAELMKQDGMFRRLAQRQII